MESHSYRSMIIVSQYVTWFLSHLLRLRFAIRAQHPAGLFEQGSADTGAGMGEHRLILAPTHQTILDPWLLASALPYPCFRALVPLRALATQTFHRPLRYLTPLIKAIYWVEGVIPLPPKDTDDGTLPEKLRGLVEVLSQGDAVLIFPEGEVGTPEGPPIGEFAPGVVYLHRVTGAPVVPIAVWMSRRGWPRRWYIVQFGRPVRIPEHLDLNAGAAWLREQTVALYEQAKAGKAGPER